MIREELNSLPLYMFPGLKEFCGIRHFITCREGGVSPEPYASFNFGYSTGDERDNVDRNIDILCKSLELERKQLFFPKQIHSSEVYRVSKDELPKEVVSLDALMTNEPGICICVKGADCVPVLFYDIRNHAVAVAHAGWKGTCSRIVQKVLTGMAREFGTRPSDIYAAIGPSIGPDAYVIGMDLYDRFNSEFLSFSDKILTVKSGNFHLNLWECNRQLLTESGVPERNIEIAGICTYYNEHLFYSHRKSGGITGRFAAGILINPEN
ncbi:MAG: peptidoglycan editing factor PgeF [Bacteroidota bacterium]